MRHFLLWVMLVGCVRWSVAQEVPIPADTGAQVREWNEQLLQSAQGYAAAPSSWAGDYRIGPEDLIEISVFEVPELSRVVRVSAGGRISLPLLGTVPAAGMSALELEESLRRMLQETYIKDPQVTVFLKEFRSDPVSVVGAVNVPGLYYIRTQKSLVELLAMAQGFSDGPQLPGQSVLITRKAGSGDSEGLRQASDVAATEGGDPHWAEIVEIPIKELLQSGDPKWNVPIYPGDVVKVVPAGTFYVAGDVEHPGGYPLADFDNVSVIQALAMAGGTKESASMGKTVIIRRDETGQRVEEKIDLKRVLKGEDPDPMLGANDILLVPGSVSKQAALRAVDAAIRVATGVLIWR